VLGGALEARRGRGEHTAKGARGRMPRRSNLPPKLLECGSPRTRHPEFVNHEKKNSISGMAR